MNISLSPELERVVQRKVRLGQYPDASTLVGEAVRQLVNADEDEHEHLTEIRRRIAAADAQIDRGEFTEYDTATLANLPRQVRERGIKRLALARAKRSRRK